MLAHAYGFLAVFAAGLALRHAAQAGTEAALESTGGAHGARLAAAAEQRVEDALHSPQPERAQQMATDPKYAPAYMAHAMLNFNEQLDSIGEMVGVVVLGLLIAAVILPAAALVVVATVLMVGGPVTWSAGLGRSVLHTLEVPAHDRAGRPRCARGD